MAVKMVFEKSIYPRLDAELIKRRIQWDDLAYRIKMKLPTVEQKMRGNDSFTIKEAKRIKNIIGIDLPLEVLFSEEAI